MNAAIASWKNAVDVLRTQGIDVRLEAYGFSRQLRHEIAGEAAMRCGLDHLEVEGATGCISLSVTKGRGPCVARWFFRSASESGLRQIVALLIDATQKVRTSESNNWVDALDAVNQAQGGESWNPDEP
ncbi:MAG: hypothetical protein HRF50_04600 [Phycisphaerae bacterium]|jgi:hypothetical protein